MNLKMGKVWPAGSIPRTRNKKSEAVNYRFRGTAPNDFRCARYVAFPLPRTDHATCASVATLIHPTTSLDGRAQSSTHHHRILGSNFGPVEFSEGSKYVAPRICGGGLSGPVRDPLLLGLKASWKTQILQVLRFCSGRELIISNCDVVRKHKPLALDSFVLF
jgi:hypothetical protein